MSESFPMAVWIGVEIVVCVAAGAFLGGRRVLAWAAPSWLALAVLALTAAIGYRRGWFQPLGLVTPLVFGVAAAVAAWIAARSLFRRRDSGDDPSPVRPGDRLLGGVLGLAAGGSLFVGAVLLASLAAAQSGPPSGKPGAAPGKASSSLSSLWGTVHRGFIRHLPVVGPAGDEVDALVVLLNADPERLRKLGRRKGWERLAELPALQAILEEERIQDDLRKVRKGDLLALYRLQKDPLVIAFAEDPVVRELAAGLTPSRLAEELRSIP